MLFEELHDPTDPAFPFIDRFARFSVGYPQGRPLGLGPLHPRGVVATYHLCDALLWLFVQEDDVWTAVRRTRLQSWPWLVEEHGVIATPAGPVDVTSRAVFLSASRLLVEFTFRSRAEHATMFSPRWMGKLNSDDSRGMTRFFHGARADTRCLFLQASDSNVQAGLHGHQETDLPSVGFSLCGDESVSATTSHEPPWALSQAQPHAHGELPAFTSSPSRDPRHFCFQPQGGVVTLEPRADTTFRFQLDMAFAQGGQAPPSLSGITLTKEDFSTLLAESREDFLQQVDASRPAQTGHPQLDTHLMRARVALLRNGLEGGGGEFKDELACLCSPDASDFSCSFFWDTLFSAVAIADFNQRYAQGAIRTAFTRHLAQNGSTPERKFNYGPPQRMAQQDPQSPIGAWALSEYLRHHKDVPFLTEMYPFLDRNHRFWEKHSDSDGDGLSEYRWTGQICDNSPLWDSAVGSYDNLGGCGWLPPIASVPLNCFLYKDAGHMADLARQLGKQQDEIYYRERQKQLASRLMDVCFVEEDRRFWDFFGSTGQHNKVKTFYMFWPLYAGLPLARELIGELIEGVLLDPNQFFGPAPFPSVAYDEKTYDPNGYWRGKAWPHISYFLLETLWRHGYRKEAQQAARRIIAYGSQSRGFLENTTTDMLQADPTYLADSSSKPDYNWGCAAFYLIARKFLF